MVLGDKQDSWQLELKPAYMTYMSSVLEIVPTGMENLKPSIISVLGLGQLGRFGLIYKGVLQSIASQRVEHD